MATFDPDYTQQLIDEIEQIPEEFRPLLLRIVHSFREGVTMPSAKENFIEGWQDVKGGKTHSIDSLWDDVDA